MEKRFTLNGNPPQSLLQPSAPSVTARDIVSIAHILHLCQLFQSDVFVQHLSLLCCLHISLLGVDTNQYKSL